MNQIEIIKALAAPVIGGSIALWIAYFAYPNQKAYDRKGANDADLRRTTADFLSVAQEHRRIREVNMDPISAFPPGLRDRFSHLTSLLEIYADSDVSVAARAIHESEAKLTLLAILEKNHTAAGNYEKASEAIDEMSKIDSTAQFNIFLEAAKAAHLKSIGHQEPTTKPFYAACVFAAVAWNAAWYL